MPEVKRRQFVQSAAGAAIGLAASTHPSEARWAEAAGPKQKIKLGQIGTAHAHAGSKMATFRKLADDYEVVGVVEPDPRRRESARNQPPYRGLKWMTERQLLATEGLQAVAVETAVCDLLPTAARSVAAGMHLHLDKPAGESLRGFEDLLGQATRRGLTVQMGYMFRNNPAFEFCFQAVREGWLGEIFEVHAVISKTVNDGVRKQLAAYAGGSMFELGCHLIDAVVSVIGEPQRVTAYTRHTRPQGDNLADNQLAVFEYPTATATIRSALVEVEGFRRRQFVVCGDQGTVEIRPLEPPAVRLTLLRPRGRFRRGYQEVELPRMPGRHDDQLLELAQIIRGQKKSDYPPSHDLAVQKAVLLASGLALQ